MLKQLWNRFITFLGDIFINKYPLFILYKPHQHKFKGEEYAEFMKMIHYSFLKPGDILLRCFDGYLDSYLIPGDLNHGGIFIGFEEGTPMVIHAIAEGVQKETLYDFMRTDHFAVVRPKGLTDKDFELVVNTVKSFIGLPYDFEFNYNDSRALYCTELVGKAYEPVRDKFQFKFSTQGFGPFKRKALVADDIFLSDVYIVFMTKSILKMDVWKKKQEYNI